MRKTSTLPTVKGNRKNRRQAGAAWQSPLMESDNVDTTRFDGEADQLRKDGATVIFAAVDGKIAGLLAIADPVKETTEAAILALQEDGIQWSC